MESAFSKPTIITRKEWGSRPVKSDKKFDVPKRIVIHHSWEPTASKFNNSATIRGIEHFHVSHNKWADIGYHFLIGPDGSCYEGRPIGNLGAHCGGMPPGRIKINFGNTGSVGICVVGNYDMETPTREAINTLISLITWLESEYNISHEHVFGHCEAWSVAPKTCPGKILFTELFGRKRWESLKF